MLTLSQQQTLTQKLTPQQVQFLKMLQLPLLALEQRIKQEMEINPLLEEIGEQEQIETDSAVDAEQENDAEDSHDDTSDDEYSWEELLPDSEDYEGFGSGTSSAISDEQDEFPHRAEQTPAEHLLDQLRMQTLTEDQLALAEEIIGNIDDDGYLRRDLSGMVAYLNKFITATLTPQSTSADTGEFESYDMAGSELFGRERLLHHTNGIEKSPEEDQESPGPTAQASPVPEESTPSRSGQSAATLSLEEMAQLSIEDLARLLEEGTSTAPERRENAETAEPENAEPLAQPEETSRGQQPLLPDSEAFFSLEEAELMLHRIQRLDPPGIGSRSLRECLLVQLEVEGIDDSPHRLATRMLRDTYHEFTMKHFEKICARLECSQSDLKAAMEVIKSLNPKPGEGAGSLINDNYITPDFVVVREGEDFLILGNDRHLPSLRVSKTYRDLLTGNKSGRRNALDRDTRKFMRQKLESAKWFIASIQQRRKTLMSVMQAIVQMQHDFFMHGPEHLRPMIYKDVAERVGIDVSTVCRVVNGKYVQSDYGVFELKYFFSEKLETASGEEVSNRVVKGKIRELIETEDKSAPLSDEELSKRLKDEGYSVARRTVAKYREQMGISVARLRRTL